MTRAMTGSLYGQVPSAAMGDVSDEDGGQSDSQLGGYAVEEPDGASPHGSELESGDDGSYALTVDSRIGRAAADNPGRNRTPSGGGVQASATAAAGVNSDVTTSAALESSTQSLARQQPPALSPSGPKPRPKPTNTGRPSLGAPIRHMTPEARSGDHADRADLDPVAQELASTMEPADGRRYLLLLRLQQQARSTGDERMADVYLQQIAAIIGNQFSGASGSGSGSSSGASNGVGASNLSDAPNNPKLPREESEQIVRDFTAAVEPVAVQYRGSITSTTSIPKVLKLLSALVDSLPAVFPPYGMQLYSLVTCASYVSEEHLVLLSAAGEEDHYRDALQLLQASVPVAPPDLNVHPYIAQMKGYRDAYGDVIGSEPRLQRIDSLLRSCVLQMVAPGARRPIQVAGNSVLMMHLLFKTLGYTEVQHMQREIRGLGSAPAALPASGAFVVESAITYAKELYAHRVEKLTKRLHATTEDIQLALVVEAIPDGEKGTPLAVALAEVKSLLQSQLLKADEGRGYAANLKFFERLQDVYKNRVYPGGLLTAENRDGAGFYAGTDPSVKDKGSPNKAGKLRAHQPPVESEASGASGASEAESGDEQPTPPDRGRTTTKAGGGKVPRAPSPFHPSSQKCSQGDDCSYLKKYGRCKYEHTPEQLKAAEAAKGNGGGARGKFRHAFMAMPCPPKQDVPAVSVPRKQLRFSNKALAIPDVAPADLPALPCAAQWSGPGRMIRRLRQQEFPKVKDKDLYSLGRVRSLLKKSKAVIKPVYDEWLTASSKERKQWVLDGLNFHASMTKLVDSAKKYRIKVPRVVYKAYLKVLQPYQWRVRFERTRVPRCDAGAACKSLLATGQCERRHSRAEVQYAQLGLAEKAAASAALAPVVVEAPEAEAEVPSLSSKYSVFLSREQAKPFDVLGDSCATLTTGNIPVEYLHDLEPLLPAAQFRLDGIGGTVLIHTVANVYCKVRAIVFDTDAEVRERFASHEYLGADALYYYFVLSMYPNPQMPKGVLLLPLGKLSRQMGWRVVIDEATDAASYVLTPAQNGVRLTIKLQVGVEGKDDDDTLLSLPDISLVSKTELAGMPFFETAQAEWARAYTQKQVLMAPKADIENRVALYGAYNHSPDVNLPYSMMASDYKF